MLRSDVARLAQILARLFVVAAAVSLLAPADVRLGAWLPLHLALAGGASCAIAGAMPDFAAALVAGRVPRWVWVPLAAFAVGAIAIAIGRPASFTWLVATGGTIFALGGLVLFAVIEWIRRHALNRRHTSVVRAYEAAALAPVVGGALGALLGTGILTSAWQVQIRSAHAVLQLFGFLALTIAATDVLLVPTVLRTRAAPWRPGRTLAAIAVGVAIAILGLAFDLPVVVVLGAAALTIGTIGVLAFAVRTTQPWPPNAERGAGAFLLASVVWLVLAAVALAVLAFTDDVADRIGVLVAAVGVGVVVQALLGAWSYLLPMRAVGGPEVHRQLLARASSGSFAQTLAFDLGAASLTWWSWGGPGWTVTVGAGLVTGVVLLVVAKVSLPVPVPDGRA